MLWADDLRCTVDSSKALAKVGSVACSILVAAGSCETEPLELWLFENGARATWLSCKYWLACKQGAGVGGAAANPFRLQDPGPPRKNEC